MCEVLILIFVSVRLFTACELTEYCHVRSVHSITLCRLTLPCLAFHRVLCCVVYMHAIDYMSTVFFLFSPLLLKLTVRPCRCPLRNGVEFHLQLERDIV